MSPRNKYGTSEKSSTSPTHASSGNAAANRGSGNPSNKSPQQSNQVTNRSPLSQQQSATEPATSGQQHEQRAVPASGGGGHKSNLPNSIEEGEEPPGAKVLPA